MSIFQNPSAHNITKISATAQAFNDNGELASTAFSVLTLDMTSSKGEDGFFQIFCDADFVPKLRSIADAINAAFAEHDQIAAE